jgi:hypothetical protein
MTTSEGPESAAKKPGVIVKVIGGVLVLALKLTSPA